MSNTSMNTEYGFHRTGGGELRNLREYLNEDFGTAPIVNAGDSLVAGGLIYPVDDTLLPLGAQNSAVPAGVTRLKVDTGVGDGELLYLWEPSGDFSSSAQTITDITINQFDGYDVTTNTSTYEFLIGNKHSFRTVGDVRGWGIYPEVENSAKINALTSKIIADGEVSSTHLTAIPGNYPITSDVNFRRISIDWKGKFTTSNNSLVILGGWSQFRPQNNQSIWGSDGQVDIRGAKGQHISIIESPLVRVYSENSDSTDNNTSNAYNTISLTRVAKLKLQGQNIGGAALGGWVNENVFYMNDVIELEVGTEPDESYKHNNNRFYGGTFEGGSAAVTMNYAVNNTMYDQRFEAVPANFLNFGAETRGNTVYISWYASDAAYPGFNLQYVDDGYGNTVATNDNAVYQTYPLYYISGDTLRMDDFTNPTTYNLLNVGDRDFNNPLVSDGSANISRPGGTLLEIPQFQWICTTPYTPCSRSGDSFVSMVLKGNTPPDGIRCRVYGYDKDFNPLTPTSQDLVVKGVGDAAFESTFPGANIDEIECRIRRSDCAYVRVAVRNGDGTLEFRSFQLSIRNPATNEGSVNGDPEDRMVGMVPIYNPTNL